MDKLGIVLELLYGKEITGPYLSRTYQHDFLPRAVSSEVGQWLKELDPRSEVLTVFIFKTHAEVWLTSEWKNSNSKLFLDRAASSQRRESSLLVKEVIQELHRVYGMKIEAVETIRLADKLASQNDPETYKHFRLNILGGGGGGSETNNTK